MNHRITFYNVKSHILPNYIPDGICIQNPHVNILQGGPSDYISPIFKIGPSDRLIINWVLEIHPNIPDEILEQPMYLGFTRCKTSRLEVVEAFEASDGHGFVMVVTRGNERGYNKWWRR